MPIERTGSERTIADLSRIDERNLGLCKVDDELNIQALEPEDIQADFLRAGPLSAQTCLSKCKSALVLLETWRHTLGSATNSMACRSSGRFPA